MIALEPIQFFLVCPLVFLGGLVDAVAGGGGLISLPAYLIAGIPVHMAVATNKLSSCMGTALAAWRYARSGYIPWRLAGACAVCAFLGSCGGARLALRLDAVLFQRLMLVILPLTAVYVLWGPSLDRTPVRTQRRHRVLAMSLAVSLLLGVYDGVYGPGTGTFLLLSFNGLAGLALQQANGATKAINLTTNLAALAVYLLNGQVIFPLGLVAGCFGLAGNYLGTRLFTQRGVQGVKPLIVLVLAVFFVKVVLELWRS